MHSSTFGKGWVGMSACPLVVLACESLHVCTVCIWRCEHARFCVEVFLCAIDIHSFIHSSQAGCQNDWNYRCTHRTKLKLLSKRLGWNQLRPSHTSLGRPPLSLWQQEVQHLYDLSWCRTRTTTNSTQFSSFKIWKLPQFQACLQARGQTDPLI